MRSNKIFRYMVAVGAGLGLLLAGPGTASAATPEKFSVQLKANANSGVTGSVRIDGLTVRGAAQGLTYRKRYVTLFYSTVSTGEVNQPTTCADPRTVAGAPLPPAVRDWTVARSAKGTGAEWSVRKSGMGTLSGTANRRVNADPVTISVSIREVPATAGRDAFIGFNPQQYPVVACGFVVVR